MQKSAYVSTVVALPHVIDLAPQEIIPNKKYLFCCPFSALPTIVTIHLLNIFFIAVAIQWNE